MLTQEEYDRTRQELQNELAALQRKFPHYHHVIEKGWLTLDVYRVLMAFEVTDPCLQHAIKKLLVAGGRGAKDDAKDIAEAIATLTRWQQIRREDELSKWSLGAPAPTHTPVPLVLPGMPGLDVPRGTPDPTVIVPEDRPFETCCQAHVTYVDRLGDQWCVPAMSPVKGCKCVNCNVRRAKGFVDNAVDADVPRGTEQPPTCLVHRYVPGSFDGDPDGEPCLAPVEGCLCMACSRARASH